MEEVSEDKWSAIPLAGVNVTEGDDVHLNVYFLQNGPSNTDLYVFIITTNETAISKAVL